MTKHQLTVYTVDGHRYTTISDRPDQLLRGAATVGLLTVDVEEPLDPENMALGTVIRRFYVPWHNVAAVSYVLKTAKGESAPTEPDIVEVTMRQPGPAKGDA